jgi:hypothetical protein
MVGVVGVVGGLVRVGSMPAPTGGRLVVVVVVMVLVHRILLGGRHTGTGLLRL